MRRFVEGRLAAMERLMLASPDQQISLTDPDSRSMATSGRGSGVVGYNVQVAVDTEHHLIVAHEVTNDGSDRAQLANIACRAKEVLGVDELEAVADRGYYSSEEILTYRSHLALRPRVASASRTLFISATRMCTAVLPEKSSPTTTPMRRMD